MPSLAVAVDRISRIGGARNWALAAAGLALLYAGLAFADRLFAPPALGPSHAAIAAFQVLNPKGRRIGTLAVDYPRRLRENQDAEVRVRYSAEAAWRSQFAAAAGPRPTLRLTAHLAAGRLALAPQPADYVFDNRRILAGGDSRSWILSPEREGDYTLLVRLDAEPAGFRSVPIAVNAAPQGRRDSVALPVAVHTRYSVPGWTVDLAKAAASLLAFLLTLPFAASLVKKWVGRGGGGGGQAAAGEVTES